MALRAIPDHQTFAPPRAVGGQGRDAARADTLKDYVGPYTNKAVIKVTPHELQASINGDFPPENDSRPRSERPSLHPQQHSDSMSLQITIHLHRDNIPLSEFQNMGNEITIERTILKAGAASFRILDSKQRLR